MKLSTAVIACAFATTASAFAPNSANKATFSSSSTAIKAFNSDAEGMPGVVAPTGFFDPLGFAAKADENTLKRYREAEITHGRVSMLAVVGFLVGEKVEGTSFLFNGSIRGPAIDHLQQVPAPFFFLLATAIAKLELDRAQYGWVPPRDVPVGEAGLLREDYVPGDFGFDPLGLKPSDPASYDRMATKELQNGRLAMLAAAGFMAQELVDHKGIIEHWTTTY
jgi:hypothetical protein